MTSIEESESSSMESSPGCACPTSTLPFAASPGLYDIVSSPCPLVPTAISPSARCP